MLDKKKHPPAGHITTQDNYVYISSLRGYPMDDKELVQQLDSLNKRYHLGVYQPRKFEFLMFDQLDD